MEHGGSGNTWASNIAYGGANDFPTPNTYTAANKSNTDPLLADVANNNFTLKPGSPAIGFGTLQKTDLPPQSTDAGACPSAPPTRP